MAITGRGKGWELRNSIWMLWAILTLGLFNYISFYYIYFRVKQRKWLIAALVYSLIFIMFIIINEIYSEKHWMTDVSFAVYLLGWIISIVHVFKIRNEYLLRLEVKIANGQREIQSLREQIRQEHENTVEAGSKVVPPQEIQKQLEDTAEMIDINTATEDEVAGIPGIGALFAKKVIEARKREGGFTSFEHFVQTLSIKPHLAEKMRPFLVFPERPATSSLKKSEGRIVDF